MGRLELCANSTGCEDMKDWQNESWVARAGASCHPCLGGWPHGFTPLWAFCLFLWHLWCTLHTQSGCTTHQRPSMVKITQWDREGVCSTDSAGVADWTARPLTLALQKADLGELEPNFPSPLLTSYWPGVSYHFLTCKVEMTTVFIWFLSILVNSTHSAHVRVQHTMQKSLNTDHQPCCPWPSVSHIAWKEDRVVTAASHS